MGLIKRMQKNKFRNQKKSKLKVKSQIQGDELRVSGQKRDDLQKIINLIKNLSLDIPVQFINFRD